MKQAQLIPDQPLVPVFEGTKPLADLPATTYTADDNLRKSVSTFGVLVPIVLAKEGKSSFRIVDGKRRRDAAGFAELDTVPVVVYDMPPGVPDSALITANEQRSTNWIAEYDALTELLKAEPNTSAISNQLSIPAARLNKVMTLKNLIAPLMKAWREGKFSATTAFSAAKLSADAQQNLVKTLKEKGKINASDVGDVKGDKEEKDDSGLFEKDPPTDRATVKKRILSAIQDASGNLDRFTPEILAEYFTDWVMGERKKIGEAAR